MVRRTHVVPGSIACCPWWTLGGGALVAAAAVTLSGAPARHAAGVELDDRASRSVEVFAAERRGEDGEPLDDDGTNGDTPLGAPPTSGPMDGDVAPRAQVAPRVDGNAPRGRESLSASRPFDEASQLGGSSQAPDAR